MTTDKWFDEIGIAYLKNMPQLNAAQGLFDAQCKEALTHLGDITLERMTQLYPKRSPKKEFPYDENTVRIYTEGVQTDKWKLINRKKKPWKGYSGVEMSFYEWRDFCGFQAEFYFLTEARIHRALESHLEDISKEMRSSAKLSISPNDFYFFGTTCIMVSQIMPTDKDRFNLKYISKLAADLPSKFHVCDKIMAKWYAKEA